MVLPVKAPLVCNSEPIYWYYIEHYGVTKISTVITGFHKRCVQFTIHRDMDDRQPVPLIHLLGEQSELRFQSEPLAPLI